MKLNGYPFETAKPKEKTYKMVDGGDCFLKSLQRAPGTGG